MTDPTDYRPISCATHSEYELIIMHKQKLRLRWAEGNVIHEEIVQPLDLQTRAHQEFLICRTQGAQTVSIRLDHIRQREVVA
jgi:transcriptional antiterminator Rof (Rho-off)